MSKTKARRTDPTATIVARILKRAGVNTDFVPVTIDTEFETLSEYVERAHGMLADHIRRIERDAETLELMQQVISAHDIDSQNDVAASSSTH